MLFPSSVKKKNREGENNYLYHSGDEHLEGS